MKWHWPFAMGHELPELMLARWDAAKQLKAVRLGNVEGETQGFYTRSASVVAKQVWHLCVVQDSEHVCRWEETEVMCGL